MANIIVVLIILIALILSISYIVKAKKNGQACVGCSYASTCNKKYKNCDMNNKTK